MTTWIALLRGINVGGRRPVAMSDLRDLLAKLGFENPRSLLQSGNLVFGSEVTSAKALERRLETEVETRLGLRTDFLVRSAREWRAIVARNPFPQEAKCDPARLVVFVLKDRPAAPAVETLESAITGRETVRAAGQQLYAVYPDGMGRSRLTIALIEKSLCTRGTGRNWNTVLRLAALAGS